MDASCPPCPTCWSADAVRIVSTTGSGGVECRCQRCGTVWHHDAERIAAVLNEKDPFPPESR